MAKKIVIVGGVAGGASAAARLRRLDETAEIIMFERGEYISFANCGLPYHIGETIQDRDQLIVQTPEKMKQRFRIDVRTQSDVVGIDPVSKQVFVESQERGNYAESYDVLILSPGAKPLRPPIPGIESRFIFTLRNMRDMDQIKDRVDRAGIQRAIVVGGGYIGVEMAENLRLRGLDVSLVEAAPHILAPFDSEMAAIAEQELVQHGLKLHLGDAVQAFRENGESIQVQLQSGHVLEGDLVILAIGVAPDTGFLKDSGIELGPRGHIVVNEHMQTNLDGVYAVGDAVETVDYVHGQKTAIPLAGPANKQGRIVADHICGIPSSYNGSQGTAIIKIFDFTGASTGLNERTLRRLNIPYQTVHLHPNAHAGYYPGAKAMSLKLLFDDQGKILGAQAFGAAGVDKRIDVIAAVIRLKGTVYDLTELELSYAPPYSSAKDPVNMAGYLAENVLAGRLQQIHADELESLDLDEVDLVDVRTEEEHSQGHIAGSINIPLDELRERMDELDRDRTIYVYCQVGLRGYLAARVLSQHGFTVKNLSGGYRTYQAHQFTPAM